MLPVATNLPIRFYEVCLFRTCMISSDKLTPSLAIHIYMIGVGIQEGFILVFLTFAITFHYTLLRSPSIARKSEALQLLYGMYIVLILITVSHGPCLSSSLNYLLILSCKDPYNLPPHRIFKWDYKHHSRS